ncbi:hypothetical protein LTR62_001892 [Meristemomyces frigidus]|uniref:Uncharacterized protein n=1 Tax=Meristemomyces frigidus TaxID=1508187 RepID=A0AAN7YM71_9PEZI|nr:hypothetical protein LTR62_001892 [Meristemomyces frigidus]
MAPPFPSMTETWHEDMYPAIDPTKRPKLSLQGKKVVISGGGAGIGRGLTQAFADAGASSIAIIGRRDSMLHETKRRVKDNNSNADITTIVADITDAASVKKAAQEIGNWDILISNAGYLSTPALLVQSEADEWWRSFEVNVKGTFNLTQAFLPSRNPASILIGINAATIQIPGDFARNFSAYNSSKLAALKILEILAAEHPDLHVVSMHPGVVESNMTRKVGLHLEHFDSVQLAGNFAVWLCSEEAKFLRGRFAWSNWDVDELKARKDEIEGSLLLTANCIGWPYSPNA